MQLYTLQTAVTHQARNSYVIGMLSVIWQIKKCKFQLQASDHLVRAARLTVTALHNVVRLPLGRQEWTWIGPCSVGGYRYL